MDYSRVSARSRTLAVTVAVLKIREEGAGAVIPELLALIEWVGVVALVFLCFVPDIYIKPNCNCINAPKIGFEEQTSELLY